jgi:tetratricopeptide (TPR) repeat protein
MNCQIAAELNNLGGAYLEAGQFKKSVELFRDALRYTLYDLQPQEVSTYGSGKGCFTASPPASLGQYEATIGKPASLDEASLSPMTRISVPASAEYEGVTSPSSLLFVHSHAINVSPSPNAYSTDTLVNTTVVSSIVVFNLGIVYHLKGLEGTGEATMRLAKAMSLYQKSQLLLVDAGVPPSSTGNPVIDSLCMALCNNMAQASFEMLAYNDSRIYFEYLIIFALTIVPSRYGDATIANLVDQQRSNFLWNAIILHAPKLAAAA